MKSLEKTDTFSGQPCLVLAQTEAMDLKKEIGRRYELKKTNVLIGTQRDVDIQLVSETRTIYEVRVYQEEGQWFFENKNPQTHTFLNEFPSRDSRLRDGDFISIGPTTFQFLEGKGLQTELFHALFRAIRIDAHTGAYNKAHFWESLDHWVAFSHRYIEPLALIMIDLDHFKKLNTEYGHLSADIVLRDLSYRLRKHLRKEDVFCRFGGEEFTIVLPRIDEEKALQSAEKLRLVTTEEPFEAQGAMISITASIGVAILERDMNKEDLMNVAEKRLRQAKHAGRNRVVGGKEDGLCSLPDTV